MNKARVLILGATYGLLPAMKIFKAGHLVTMVCRPDERSVFLNDGAKVIFKGIGGQSGQILDASVCPGRGTETELGVVGPDTDVQGIDLAIFAISEPLFSDPELSGLVGRIGRAGIPVVSISNAPPPPFLERLNGFPTPGLRPAYGAWETWAHLDPDRTTAASPDAQAVRRDPARLNELTVTLGSNFKVAPFARQQDQSLLNRISEDVESVRLDGVPVKVRFKVDGSLYAPFAKWPMLIAGNCRCLNPDGSLRPISAAVHDDVVESERIYEWTLDLVRAIGAADKDLVPFRHYAAVAKRLSAPSSFARAVANGSPLVERVDKMIQLVGQEKGQELRELDQLVDMADALVCANTSQQRAKQSAH